MASNVTIKHMVNRVERGDLKGKHRKVGSDEVKTLVITAVQIDHYTSTFPRKNSTST